MLFGDLVKNRALLKGAFKGLVKGRFKDGRSYLDALRRLKNRAW